jgi:hypothetical protein
MTVSPHYRADHVGIVKSRLRQAQPLTGRELPFLREHAPGLIKMTLLSAKLLPSAQTRYDQERPAIPAKRNSR